MTWRFAENQWDVIGEGNANISPTYKGRIDLFGWGTSGHPHGATCYQPWSTSQTDNDYYAYGSYEYNLYDQTGEADWGCNPISNGGDKPNQWRTLTKEEWTYLLNSRSGKRYARATVNGVSGLIVLPDGWKTSYYSLNSTNSATAAFTSNIITAAQWPTLEQHGAVFLPAVGGYRSGTVLDEVGESSYYWSSSCDGGGITYSVYIGSSGVGVGVPYEDNPRFGNSVRLVCQSNPRIRTIGMTNVTGTTATVNAEVDCTGSATVTERGVCYNTMGTPTVNNIFQAAGSGTGGFSAQLTDLSNGITYHVRAYAKIGGTYRYGNELTFTTTGALAVTTAPVTDISATYAYCGGTVSDCGQNVTARGLCWGTSSSPTLSDSHSYEGAGTGSFTSMMENLELGVTYYVRAYATTEDGTTYGNVRSFITHTAYVDLGLPSGTLWAICNVGASNPEDLGDSFAWGETTPKTSYSWSNYQHCMGSEDYLTKYCWDGYYGYAGYTDDLFILLPEDDAATANWGDDWRMPSRTEWIELYNNTTRIWTTQNGVEGCLFSADNGNSLFLPASGYSHCAYWSNLLWGELSPTKAYRFYFNSVIIEVEVEDRCEGLPVRAVRSSAKN